MILGLGSDVVDIRRIERTLERFGSRFITRIFTEQEQSKAERRAGHPRLRASAYAKRFAAKEACAKALGTGFRAGVAWRDLGVVNLASGRPSLVLTGAARERLAALTPAGMVAQVDLTLTDEYPLAQAVVLISATA
ncbi:MAG: holo-ACP synthase [Alphaproteobacteria bacterium]|nr:holo-ACP synthase [Alphaproteobacteria bacterium]